LLICRGDYRCAHSVIINADRWPDHIRLSGLEPQFVCQACRHRGADVRPDFSTAKKRPGARCEFSTTRVGP
jgi:hypothetical protein